MGAIETFPKSNSFWITDTLLNLQRIEALLDKLDVPLDNSAFIQIKNTKTKRQIYPEIKFIVGVGHCLHSNV